MSEIKVRVGQQPSVKVISSFAGVRELSNLNDVDTANASNGSILVYNSTTKKWESISTMPLISTSNYVLTTNAYGIPTWTDTLDGGVF